MCGIAGFWSKSSNKNIEIIIKEMTHTIKHRGPDDEGIWINENDSIALGHKRLSIVDLSPNGHQPMVSQNERYVITFNGEIYNFQKIRLEIENISREKGYTIKFKGTSDTEVILAAVEVYGLQKAIARFKGMFAFSIYDRKEKKLYLVRDRLGEKPLYYGYINSDFIFASELKAICSYQSFNREIDRDVLALYFRHNYIPAPYSIYKGIYKLLPGTILTIENLDGRLAEPEQYWSAKETVINGMESPFGGSNQEALEYLEALLKDSIKGQMVADVPLGAFLSGGIDSSLVVALMQAQSSNPVKTFTIGFNEDKYNEAKEAKRVATYLGTDHTELYVQPKEAMGVINDMPILYDEPFADSSQIPTFLVSKLAKSHVTVSLSGDGGDELFGGYSRYLFTENIWRKIGWLPSNLRSNISNIVKVISPHTWDQIFNLLSPFIPTKHRVSLFGDKIYKMADVIGNKNVNEIYRSVISLWKNPGLLVLNSLEPDTLISKTATGDYFKDIKVLMMYLDMVTYLPDDILVKVDRAAMGVSLESRVPFLDHKIVEFAWQLPISLKIKNGQGKWPLRQILYKYVPKELIDRPKMGFGVPIDEWLKGPLKDWAETLLNEKRLISEGFLNPEPIKGKWIEHQKGYNNWQYYLWTVLMFQSWLETQKK